MAKCTPLLLTTIANSGISHKCCDGRRSLHRAGEEGEVVVIEGHQQNWSRKSSPSCQSEFRYQQNIMTFCGTMPSSIFSWHLSTCDVHITEQSLVRPSDGNRHGTCSFSCCTISASCLSFHCKYPLGDIIQLLCRILKKKKTN